MDIPVVIWLILCTSIVFAVIVSVMISSLSINMMMAQGDKVTKDHEKRLLKIEDAIKTKATSGRKW